MADDGGLLVFHKAEHSYENVIKQKGKMQQHLLIYIVNSQYEEEAMGYTGLRSMIVDAIDEASDISTFISTDDKTF